MSHDHSHAKIINPHSHAENMIREYRGYYRIFVISFISAAAEFLIAKLLANSIAAQADAIHAFTHLSLYALALFVSWRIMTQKMDVHSAHHYRDKFVVYYAILVFTGVTWIVYTSISKFFSTEHVASGYMLLSVGIGLCGNIIALNILNAISQIHGTSIHRHKGHRLINLDAWQDLFISVGILVTSVMAVLFPKLPMHIIDPALSLIVAAWIGCSSMFILRGKTIE